MTTTTKTTWTSHRNWTPQPGQKAAFSIAAPFGCAIAWGFKGIELRTWGTTLRGKPLEVLLHQGKSWYGEKDYGKAVAQRYGLATIERLDMPDDLDLYPLGALIGVARLVKCARFSEHGWETLREQHCSLGPWDPRIYGWQFEAARSFRQPIPFPGALGLFPIPDSVVAAAIETALTPDEWLLEHHPANGPGSDSELELLGDTDTLGNILEGPW